MDNVLCLLCSAALILTANTSISPWILLVPFKLLPGCYSSEGVSLSPCVGSLRVTAWDSRNFMYWLNPCWFSQPQVTENHLSGTGTLGWRHWYGAGTPCSQDIPPDFLSTTCECGTSLFHFSTPPTSLAGCDFFNYVVVRLPFNSKDDSDGSEWWLFYILVVILMCLCKEVSCFLLRPPSWPEVKNRFCLELLLLR